MLSGKRVLIAAHGNSLRALIMYLEKLTPEQIMQVNLPTGIPMVYTIGDHGEVLGKTFLGDAQAIAQQMQKVSDQGKAQR